MPLTVPSLTFSKTDKGDEYLPKDQVTRLIDDMQRAHTAAVTEALKPVQAEVTRLEAAHKEAQGKAAKAVEYERDLSELRGKVERRDVAAELLGLTDSTEIEDLHSLYQSRTAGLEQAQRPAFRAWAEGHLAKPENAPALVRSVFEQAAKARQGQQGQGQDAGRTVQGQGQQGQGVSSGPRKATSGPNAGAKVTLQDIQRTRPGTPEYSQIRARWREQQGLPALPVKDSTTTT